MRTLPPLEPPYDPEVESTLERMVPPGMEPIRLFRTVAHNRHVLDRLRSTGAYLLAHGILDPVEREIVIHRACARCGCEYEWGVHVAVFARRLGLSDEQIAATVHGDADDPAWDERQSLLVRMVDELHDTGTLTEATRGALAERHSPAELVELVTLCGQYHAISFMANGLGVELEEYAERFPAAPSRAA